ncbi:MAG TPA: DUF4126 family protein [Bryobacteraceae bacterium]|jgi:uncharacterized membrane protein|nr:DUF4126 family protein [Bryobacteraceae bacterium]
MEENVFQSRDAQIYAGATALGVVAGMRSLAAPAILGRVGRAGCFKESGADVFKKPVLANTLLAMAIAEFVADKLPFMPKRTQTASLIARVASGAICGAIFCSALKRSPVIGAVAGASAALGATYAVYELRRSASEQLGLPDPAVALAEDAIAAWVGLTISDIASGKTFTKSPKEMIKREVHELAELRRHPLA